jgi:hypothetical protein
MVELRQVLLNGENTHRLFIDERELNAEVEYSFSTLEIYAPDPEVMDLLLTQSFADLSKLPDEIKFPEFPNILKVWEDIAVQCILTIRRDEAPYEHDRTTPYGTKTTRYKFGLELIGSPGLWRYPWTIKEYKLEFMSILAKTNVPGFFWDQLDDWEQLDHSRESPLTFIFPEIKYSCVISDDGKQIGDEVTRSSDIIRRIHERTERALIEHLSPASLAAYFRFPPEVKVACGQYLLYFTQFLRDLGIEASAALTEETEQVLLRVTPTNELEALDKIRVALHVFLQLPSIPINDVGSEGIAVQKLEANILRLKGDLKLAAAEIQAKNATIETQRLRLRFRGPY